MTRDEAYAEYRRQTDILMIPLREGEYGSAPIMELIFELETIVQMLRDKSGAFSAKAYVEHNTIDANMLIRALTAPRQITWTELTKTTERDPVSGNMRTKMKTCQEPAPCAQGAHDVRYRFVACIRTFAAFAKSIASPTYPEWREMYIALETYYAHKSMLNPMELDFARSIVQRFKATLFTLWADNEIEKEIRHV